MPQEPQAAIKGNRQNQTLSPPTTSDTSSGGSYVPDNRDVVDRNKTLQAMMANSVAPPPAKNTEGTARAVKENSPQETYSFDLAEISDDYNLEKEKEIKPKSDDNKKKLTELEKSGAVRGENAQIELAGELTYAAKFNRFIGKESTYSILQRKAQEFNKSKDVAEKQSLLKELKPLAQTWLEKHAISQSAGDNEDANEKLKRESVYKFLYQITSNAPEVLKVYESIKSTMEKFGNAPVQNRSSFHQAVLEYNKVKDLIKTYKSTYPPAVNLLYFSELEAFNKADEEILKSGKIKGIEFDTKLGFSVKDPLVTFDLYTGTITFSGNLNVSIPGLSDAEGNVMVIFNSDESFNNITISEGKFAIGYNGFDFSVNSFDYAFKSNEFKTKLASGSVTIFDQTITVNATNITVKNQVIDFETVSGKLPNVDVGFFGINETTITYDKQKRELTGKTQYNFNTKDIPKIEAISTTGDLQIHWHLDDPTKRCYDITNGTLSFKIFDQSATATEVSYNSKNSDIESKNIDLTLNVPKVGEKTISGKNIKINKDGLNFSEIKTEASGEPITYSIFSISPKAYILKKESEGYNFKVAGEVKLTLPEFLGINSNAKIDGSLGVNLSKLASPTYDIDTASVEFSAANPLSKLSSLLGDNATAGRYEIVGGFPIFPGVNAEFGAYLNYGADFGKTITASISWIKESEKLEVNVGVKDFKAKVGAGLLAGIGLGLSLIAALQLRLKAGAAIDVTGALGYKLEYKLSDTPKGTGFDSLGGALTYDLGGGLNMEALLEIVATALYFFQKSFEITIASKELGSFKISDKEKFKFIEAKSELASKEQLEEHIDEDKKEEYKESKYKILDLLSMDFTERFKAEDKDNVVKTFEEEEKGRKDKYIEKRKVEGEKNQKTFSFYDTPIIDLNNFDDFMNKRCSWDGLHQVINELGETLKSKAEIVEADGKTVTAQGKDYLDNKILPNLEHLGKSSNMADAFVTHYEKKINYFVEKYVKSRNYQAEGLQDYIQLLNEKLIIFRETNSIKRYVHSQRKGDEKQQKEQVVTSGWFLGKGESNYEAFSKAYSDFVKIMKNQNEIFKAAQVSGKLVKMKLISAHNEGRFKKK